MALTITSPENSFIQFVSVDAEPGTSCEDVLFQCLPIHLGDDFRFQFFVAGQVPTVLQDNYKVYIYTLNDDVVSDAGAIVWSYDSATDITTGTFSATLDISDLISMGLNTCAKFVIARQQVGYFYSNVNPAFGNLADWTIHLTIDGVNTLIGGGVFSNMDDLVLLLNSYFITHSINALATHATATSLNIQATGGNVFGTLIVDDGRENDYTPVATTTVIPEYESNCIKYVTDPCFTTVLKYRCNENSFGFDYSDDTFYNQARLFFFINNPQPVTDENYFTLSNGAKKVLSARFEKEYEAHVDYLDQATHFRLSIALKHDVVQFDGTGFTAQGDYKIGWLNVPGINQDSAPAEFKARPNPYFEINSNCS